MGKEVRVSLNDPNYLELIEIFVLRLAGEWLEKQEQAIIVVQNNHNYRQN